MRRMRAKAKSLLKEGVDRLPPKARSAVLAAVSAVRDGQGEPPPRQITFPPDVADRESVREYLADTDIFGEAVAEAHGYLSDALDRFRITMALLPPSLAPGARVLELGANPYFLTRLLIKRGYKVTCANYFGEDYDGPSVQVVSGQRTGERHEFEFDHFNIERDPFPYADDSFDLVLCCEILEHLPSDPIHMLAEISRVTAPGGSLLLTTPNATRATNLLRIMAGENPYEEMSGYGTYGRHNREYTVAELRLLLDALGYAVDDCFAIDIHDGLPGAPALPGIELADRGDNLFALARPVDGPRWRYPSWLYASRHAIKRMVLPDVRCGYNDEVQARGLHDAERFGAAGDWACWTAADSAVFDVQPVGSTVTVEGWAPPSGVPGPVTLTVDVAGSRAAASELACDGERFTISATVAGMEDADAGGGPVEVVVSVPTWSPAELGMSADTRRLGVAISRVALG